MIMKSFLIIGMREIKPKYRASGGGIVIDTNEVKQEEPLMVDRIIKFTESAYFNQPSSSFNK